LGPRLARPVLSLDPGSSAYGRRVRGRAPKDPGARGPQASLSREGRSKGVNQANRGLHDTARSRPSSDPDPTQADLGGARVHSPALSSSFAPSSPSLSLLPGLNLSNAPSKPGRAGPTQRGGSGGARPRSRQAGTRTYSLGSRGHGARLSRSAAVAARG
jgi:hypothetical protein